MGERIDRSLSLRQQVEDFEGDVGHPAWRATSVGVYRFWRDLGYAVGALMAGVVAAMFGLVWAVHVAGIVTLMSGLVAWSLMKETLPSNVRAAITDAS